MAKGHVDCLGAVTDNPVCACGCGRVTEDPIECVSVEVGGTRLYMARACALKLSDVVWACLIK